jgi:hypothetical protein
VQEFYAPELIFCGTEDVVSRFDVLSARTRFRLYRGRCVLFSCFARPNSFLAVPRLSCPFFMFYAPELVFGSTEGVVSRFHVLRAGLVFGGTEAFVSRFHVLRARTHFRRYKGRRVPFSCFARPDSFSAILRPSCPVFMFCAPGLVIGCTVGVGSRFQVLRARTHFRRYRGRRFLFLRFARPDSFSTVPRASGPVFIFYAPGLIFDDTEGVRSCFQVLNARTHFRRYRGRRVPLSCFACPNSFSAVPRASFPVFMFCAP